MILKTKTLMREVMLPVRLALTVSLDDDGTVEVLGAVPYQIQPSIPVSQVIECMEEEDFEELADLLRED